MNITPGSAVFSDDEQYRPLRIPNIPLNQAAPQSNNLAAGMNIGGFNQGHHLAAHSGLGGINQRMVSPVPSLSPFAQEFVPRVSSIGTGGLGNNSIQDRLTQYRQPSYPGNQQQYQDRRQHEHQQRSRADNSLYNGFVDEQQRYNQHQQQAQPYAQQMNSISTSMQERMNLGRGGAAGSSNASSNSNKGAQHSKFYQPPQLRQQQQQQQQHNHHNQHNQHNQQQKYNRPQNRNNNYYNPQQPRYQNAANHHNNAAKNSSNSNSSSGADLEAIALEYLKTAIQCLSTSPGEFDNIATRFLTIFDGMENNRYVLSNAMEDIFNESISNTNFRYMGARLYNLLHMLNLNKDSLFQSLLKCKLDFHQEEMRTYLQSGQDVKVRNTAVFLAELYMQLRGDDSRIHLIAENIVGTLKLLLDHEHLENVRCVGLTLKLAGYDLTSDCASDMQQIIAKLTEYNSANPGKCPLAANVISLQKNNWGRKISSPNTQSEEMAAASAPLRTSDEPIFYGPDGRELTAEETEFLHTGGGANSLSGGGDGDGGHPFDDDDELVGDIDLDPEMDEETERAYKEFCKLNFQKK